MCAFCRSMHLLLVLSMLDCVPVFSTNSSDFLFIYFDTIMLYIKQLPKYELFSHQKFENKNFPSKAVRNHSSFRKKYLFGEIHHF